jgi:long-chain fatty acid transport protein
VDDVFDVELDLSYTRNSAYHAAELRFPERPIIAVNGTGGQVPQDADVDFNVKGDTIGVRLGGDYIVLPERLAVRAGAFYEPDVQRPEYLNVAMVASRRIGLAGGVQVRLDFVDLEASYMHVFFDEVDNGGNGRLRVVNGEVSAVPVPNRSPYAINGGKVTQSANIVSLGARARF